MTYNSNERMQIVFISGGPRGRGELVFVDWVEDGAERQLLDDMERFATDKLGILATAYATHRDVNHFFRKHAGDHHHHNGWFKLTPAVMRGIAGEIKRERAEMQTARWMGELRQAA
jgi:hypothetical protein